MKIGKLFLCVIASAALFAGCKEEEPTVSPSISVDAASLKTFSIQGGQDEIQQVTVTSNRDWEVVKEADWIHVNPESGNASSEPQSVDIYVESNTDGIARSAKITFSAGVVSDVITVSQEGKEVTYTDIADLRTLGASQRIADATYIKGVVISDQMNLDNLSSNKSVYIQDETAGIQLFFAENVHEDYVRGDEVTVDVSGLLLSTYGQALQIVSDMDSEGNSTGVPVARISKVSSGNAIQAKEITMEQLLSYEFESQYVSITDPVQVVDADLEKTFVEGGKATSIKFTDAQGRTLEVRTSQYAKFKDEKVPQGSGILKGIASRYNSTAQIIFSTDGDWTALTGARFEIETPDAEKITVADFLAKEEGAAYYELEGVVTDLYNTDYGNFTLVDDTGEVLVYGLDASATAGDKTFSQTGVKEGDIVVLAGQRSSFNGTPQVGNAYYISHKEGFSVSPLTLSIPADGGEVTFTVSGGATWTAVSDNDAFTVGTASGTGAATVTVSAGANDTGETISGTITVSTEEDYPVKSYEISISQAAPAVAGSGWTLVSSSAEITDGEYVILCDFSNVSGKSGVWILNTAEATAKFDAAATDISTVGIKESDGKLEGVTDEYVWNFKSSGSGFTVNPKNNDALGLGAVNDNNGLRVNTDSKNQVWTFANVSDSWGWEIVTEDSAGNSRYLCGYETDNWRTYKAVSSCQTKNWTIRIYKNN